MCLLEGSNLYIYILLKFEHCLKMLIYMGQNCKYNNDIS